MSETEWLSIFGDNLQYMLDRVRMTQRDLAEETGLSEASISRYINKERIPSVRALVNIANALDCSLDDIMDFGDTIEG